MLGNNHLFLIFYYQTCLDLFWLLTTPKNNIRFVTPDGTRKYIHQSRDFIPERQALNRRQTFAIQISDHIFSIPSCRLHIVDTLGRMRSGRVLIFTDERIWVILLLEVPQGMIDLPMLGLVRSNVQQ